MRVGVVGMGAAGLYAARLLEGKVDDLRLFEARARVGGRLHTVGDSNGLAYDAGGEWLDADHHRALSLAQELGCPAEPTPRWPGLVVYQGSVCTEDDLWPEAVEDELRFEAMATELAQSLHPTPWLNTELAELDRISLQSFIDDHAESALGRWWLKAKYRSDESEDPERIGLLGWLVGFRHYLDREPDCASAYRMQHGMGVLFSRLAETIQTPIHFRKELTRVVQEGDSILLQFPDGETRVDRVILALPPKCLERIIFDPPLPAKKRCALEACQMSRCVKISMVFEKPWWKDEGWNGSMMCDMPLQQTWEATRGSVPVLNAYVGGSDADFWTHQRNVSQEAIRQLSEIFPAAEAHFREAFLYDWIGDSFAGGGFSNLAPGYVMEHMEHIASSIGGVHYAGEHTAAWTGFIEGALESGERAAEEVLSGA